MKLSKEDQIVKLLKARDETGMKFLLKYYKPLMYYIITPILSNGYTLTQALPTSWSFFKTPTLASLLSEL